MIGEDVQLQEIFSRCYPSEPKSDDAMGYVPWHHDAPTPGCYRWVKVQVLLSDAGLCGLGRGVGVGGGEMGQGPPRFWHHCEA